MRLLVVGLLFGGLACATGTVKTRPVAQQQQPLPPLSEQAYAHYLRGRLAALDGDHERSVQEFRLASDAAPQEVSMRMSLAESLYRSGKPELACNLVERAQVEWPDRAEVWTLSGRINRGLGRDQLAADDFARAIELAPDDEAAHLGLAASYLSLQQPRKAEKAYRALVRKLPLSVQGNYLLAVRLLIRGEPREAQGLLARALERDPDHTAARVALARAQRAQGEPTHSAETLREAFYRTGGDPEVGQELFYQLLELADRESALVLLRELDRETVSADVRLGFGDLYLAAGAPENALELADKLLVAQPGSGEASLLKARALRTLGRGADAVPLLLEVTPSRLAYPECRAMAAELLAEAGAFEPALAAIAEAKAKRPNHAQLISGEARVLELAGKVEQARELFAAAVKKHPDDIDLLYAFGSLEDRQGNRERGAELVARVLAAEPENAEALNFVGYSLADRGVELERAERLLRRAVELAPGNGFVLDSYGWLLFRRGKLERATEVLVRAQRLAPAQPEILWHLGELHLARNQRERALDSFERGRAMAPAGRTKQRLEDRIHSLRAQK